MKRNIIIIALALAATALSSCQEHDYIDGEKKDIYVAEELNYKGHVYIPFCTGHPGRGSAYVSVVHAPHCPCHSEGGTE